MTRFARLIAAALPAAALLSAGTAAQDADDIHAPWDAFLSTYVVDMNGMNLLRYGDVSDADHNALKGYIDALEGLKPSAMGEDEQLAFYFNLYNAAIVDLALDNYPLDSIRDVGGGFISKGPWKIKVVTVEGEELSFDDIEHGTVRANFDEPRVHYAFNCASFGCPDLRAEAWRAETLDADLDAAARRYVAHPRGIRIDGKGRVFASSIYKWFQEDFGGNEKGVIDHVSAYAVGDKKTALDAASGVKGFDYDWDLNEPR